MFDICRNTIKDNVKFDKSATQTQKIVLICRLKKNDLIQFITQKSRKNKNTHTPDTHTIVVNSWGDMPTSV